MMLTNYHTHTHFCDGSDAPERYAEEAVKQSLGVLGYTSHAPVPFPCSWTLPAEDYPAYLEAVQALQAQYRGRLEILCGLEVDYFPDLWPDMKTSLKVDRLDYFIGAIHFVDRFADGTPWSIDGSHDEFLEGWKAIFGKETPALVKRYFGCTRQMVREMRPPVIAHLDKLKMQSGEECPISESDPVYRAELVATLEEIASSGCVVEINTRGVYGRKEPEFYPSRWALSEMRRREIPIMINSDAHRPREIVLLHREALLAARQAGYRRARFLSGGEWTDYDIAP